MRPAFQSAKIVFAVLLNWDGRRYAEKLPKMPGRRGSKASIQKEASQQRQYPPLPNKDRMSDPGVIVDKHGIILVWYLPGILMESRQVGLFAVFRCNSKPVLQNDIIKATEKLNPLLKKSLTEANDADWRNNKRNFKQAEAHLCLGSINISPGWFQQGHEVSVSACRIF